MIFSRGGRRQCEGALSEEAPEGPMSSHGAPRGWARPMSSWLTGAPPRVCSVPKNLKYCRKTIPNFQVIPRTFIIETFLWDN